MNDFNSAYAPGHAGALDTSRDAGLRAFMLGVYNKMALGLVWSAILAYAVGTWAPATNLVFGTPLFEVVRWGPIALLFGSMFFMRNPSPVGSAVLYWSVVTLIGMGLGVWVFAAATGSPLQSYPGTSYSPTMTTIAQAFSITAAAFAGLSLWGYTTKRNLTGIGSFLIMASWGAVLLAVVNMFLIKSTGFELLIQIVFLGLMAGIVAWQTQALKVSYHQLAGNGRGLAVMTNMGALNLYIAFINMFQILMSLLSRD